PMIGDQRRIDYRRALACTVEPSRVRSDCPPRDKTHLGRIPEVSAMPSIPKTMRAAAIDRFGGPEEVTLHTLPVPEIGTREILIAVHTAGVGSWDAGMRGGWWPEGKPDFPLVLGSDGSGTVVKLGSQVRGFKDHDEVYAYSFANPKGGFHAEYVAVPAANMGHRPRRLNLEEVGAI